VSSDVIVLAREAALREVVRAHCAAVRRECVFADDLAALESAAARVEWSDAVVDRDHEDADAAVARLAARAGTERRILVVVQDVIGEPPAGAHAVVFESVLGRALRELAQHRGSRPLGIERLLAASLLDGPLDDAIDAAMHEVAVAFGVARCVMSERADPAGAVLGEGATVDAEAWNITAKRCRAAAALDAALVAPAPRQTDACDTYLAVRLDTAEGPRGFLALVATSARVYSPHERAALVAVASRLSAELRWRGMYARTTDELERALSNPGYEAAFPVWNRHALDRLADAAVSNAKRAKLPLGVLAVRAVGLAAINARGGVAIGDRVLARIADALRSGLRGEDLVGRYTGSVFVVILLGVGADEAQRVARRIQEALAGRVFELPSGETIAIATTIAVATLREQDDGNRLLARAADATNDAPDNVVAMATPTSIPGRAPHVSQALELRARLGGTYRLRHEISRGGMGVVYRADDLSLERPVAIKMLRPDLAEDDDLVEHLRREAALLARLHHPNLVQIYSFGRSEGDCYFVMELVEGESQQQAIDRHILESTQMPVTDVLAIIEQVASALGALHERGIVHRDVKPANIIRDPFSGRSVLVDVGIAHGYGQLAKLAGTPGYMAPEVSRGEAASVRSDVYGLAAAAYAMLVLAPVWGDGTAVEILGRQWSHSVPRASSARAELAPIDDVLAAALSADVDERPASAGAFARSLALAFGTILPKGGGKPRAPGRAATVAYGSPTTDAPRTRGVVFRSVARAVGVRDADRVRDALGNDHPELAHALAQSAPLAWAPTELFVQLLASAPPIIGREPARLARDIARATVRTSFRSFFPASAATVHPERTLSAIRSIWSRYHSWGAATMLPVRSGEAMIRLVGTLRDRLLCEWAAEMIETLVVLSGGTSPAVAHERCEARGDDGCAFRVTWQERG
jgi:serine/threonine-protein kinase